MKSLLATTITLVSHGAVLAHPGHHHQPGLSEVHGFFSWEQLVWTGVLALVVAVFLRSR
jgi:hypothetical protein